MLDCDQAHQHRLMNWGPPYDTPRHFSTCTAPDALKLLQDLIDIVEDVSPSLWIGNVVRQHRVNTGGEAVIWACERKGQKVAARDIFLPNDPELLSKAKKVRAAPKEWASLLTT